MIAVTQEVSGKTASVRANNSNGPQGHWSSCHPHHFPSPARQSGESDHRACSRTRHIRSDFRCRVSAGSFIPTRNPLSSSGEWGRKLLVHRSCSTHARARGARRCAGIADPLPTDPLDPSPMIRPLSGRSIAPPCPLPTSPRRPAISEQRMEQWLGRGRDIGGVDCSRQLPSRARKREGHSPSRSPLVIAKERSGGRGNVFAKLAHRDNFSCIGEQSRRPGAYCVCLFSEAK